MVKGATDKADKKDTKVVEATFSAITLKRLDALVREGSFGITRPEVIRNFVETGLRAARKDNHISEEEWNAATPPPAASTPSTDG